MQKIKNIFKTQKGSALVLTLIVLVNALLIVSAISVISIMERSMSGKVKSSTPAFQSADSGLEYALQKIKNASSTDPISVVCGAPNASTGKADCSSEISQSVSLYFLKDDGTVMTSGQIKDVASIRSVGQAGNGEDVTTRAIEAAVAANVSFSAEQCTTGTAVNLLTGVTSDKSACFLTKNSFSGTESTCDISFTATGNVWKVEKSGSASGECCARCMTTL